MQVNYTENRGENNYPSGGHTLSSNKDASESQAQFGVKQLFVFGVLMSLFITIVSIFYYQEMQYLVPTPQPNNYQPIAIGQPIQPDSLMQVNFDKPVVLHFFNPDCPCSRFNMDHVQQLVRAYNGQVNFYAVLQVEEPKGAAENFQEKYGLDIPVILDSDKQLAVACGVYATPQAAILTKKGELYYRGNYNKARYCTNPQSDYAKMALDSLLAGKPAPAFVELATKAYGCQLPDQPMQADIFSNIKL